MKITVDDPTFGTQAGGTTGAIAGAAAVAAVDEHEADPIDAHDASAISILDPTNVRFWPMLSLMSGVATSGNYYGSDNVEGALAEIGAALEVLRGGTPRYWPLLSLSSAPFSSGGGAGGDTSGQFIVGFDAGIFLLVAGKQQDMIVPFAGTITSWTILADVTGSAAIDIWKDSYANFAPTVADSITAAAKPTLSNAIKATSSTLTGWTTAVSAGDVLRFNLDSVSGLHRLLLVVAYSRP